MCSQLLAAGALEGAGDPQPRSSCSHSRGSGPATPGARGAQATLPPPTRTPLTRPTRCRHYVWGPGEGPGLKPASGSPGPPENIPATETRLRNHPSPLGPSYRSLAAALLEKIIGFTEKIQGPKDACVWNL